MLKIGTKMPAFEGIDQEGNPFDSHQLNGHPAVIYFYPKDHTPGCTAEACGFRDAYEDFTALGAQVVGVSMDTVRSHQRFAQRHQLPFTLLADTDKTIHKKFRVGKQLLGLFNKRLTYVVDAEGVIIQTYENLLGTPHIKEALRSLKKNQKTN